MTSARSPAEPSLDALEQLIKQVFVPLLGANGDGADAEGGAREARARSGGGREKSANASSPPPKEATPNVGEGAKKSASALSAAPFRARACSPPRSRPSSRATRGSSAARARAARRLASDPRSLPQSSAVDLTDARASAEDADTARKLEAAVVEWTAKISDATRREEARRVLGAVLAGED